MYFLQRFPPLSLLVLTAPPPTTIRPLLRCLPLRRAEAAAEGDILTVSCYTANKRTFLNDELLLCKWHLTETVSARQSPEVQSTAEAAAVIVIIFMIAGTSERGGEGRSDRGLHWMSRSVYRTVADPHMENTAQCPSLVVNGLTFSSVFQTTLALKVKKLLVICFAGVTCTNRHHRLDLSQIFQALSLVLNHFAFNASCSKGDSHEFQFT